MSTTSFSQLVAGVTATDGDRWRVTIPADWMQGRTTYGGLSAALCLQAVQQQFPELPPLRAAQINFIGPAGGEIEIEVNVLRQGRSVTYIMASATLDGQIATHAVFCFGASRESRLDADYTIAPNVPNVDAAGPFFTAAGAPVFTQHFECKLASGGQPVTGSDEHEHHIWVRHKDTEATGIPAMLGIADMPPPAVLPMFSEPAPISSMTWSLNFLSDDFTVADNWWLIRTAAENARHGYSSQDMQIWNEAGELVISAQQSVAVFY